MLSCCKGLFEQIGANLAHIQPENLQNLQKMHFRQKAPGVGRLSNKTQAYVLIHTSGINKLMSVFHASVMNFVITLSK